MDEVKSSVISECRYPKQGLLIDDKGNYYLQKLMPKDWVLSDYDPKELVIEIEDETDGHRFWVPAQKFFGRIMQSLTLIDLYEKNINNIVDTIEFDKFSTVTNRKREYLIAHFYALPF